MSSADLWVTPPEGEQASDRLDRDFDGKRLGDTGYAREEAVAELAAAFLCEDLGTTPEPRGDHASYLALDILREGQARPSQPPPMRSALSTSSTAWSWRDAAMLRPECAL